MTARTEEGSRLRRGGFRWLLRLQVIAAEPRGLLRLSEHGWLVKQGADTVEGASAGRMPPAEATDAMEA
jgi:hypothetical protein